MCLRIRNWHEFQQYKDRCPPWIKLHREMLQSEDWVMWDDASRVLAIACMLLASRTEDGTIPNNPKYIERAAYLNGPADLRPLIDCGFLVLEGDASEAYRTLASCTTETETERETETETEAETEVEGRAPRPKPKRSAFTPPTVDQVEDYRREKGYRMDPEAFVDFYESKGWMVGKAKMKNWKAAVRNWMRRAEERRQPGGGYTGMQSEY